MTDVINLIFSQDFLQRALIAGILISLCTALLGVSLVLKRFSMIGDGLSHVAFGAMAIATAAGFAPLYFSIPIVIIAAFLLLRMSENGKIKGDAAIALISTGALAVGVLATSMTTGMNVDIYNYMFGSILTMSKSDVVLSCTVAAIIIALFLIFYHEIFSVTFDESFAKAVGTKVTVYNMLIAALTAVTIVIGMKMMGALLISSLIIFPTVTSMRLCKSYKKVVVCSVIVSIFCFISGLFLSVKLEAPTGASIVVMNILFLGVFSLVRKVLNSSLKCMNKKIKHIVIFFICMISIAAMICSMFFGSADIYEKDKISVVTTAFAQFDFARQIAGDKADVIMLLKPGEESHTYEPTPNDIIKIKECDVFVRGGGESEKWAESILESVDVKMADIKMMDIVELHKTDIDEGTEEHEHSHNDYNSELHDHREEYDEHVWTSPLNAIKISGAICYALCEIDFKNSTYYKNNLKKFTTDLLELDAKLEKLISEKNKDYVIIGDRFPMRYFTMRYSLDYFAAFPGCSAQVEANPVTVAFLCNKVKQDNIPVIFKMDFNKGEIAKTIAEQTGADIETLWSCHVISAEDFENGETYLSLMERNYIALNKALY